MKLYEILYVKAGVTYRGVIRALSRSHAEGKVILLRHIGRSDIISILPL